MAICDLDFVRPVTVILNMERSACYLNHRHILQWLRFVSKLSRGRRAYIYACEHGMSVKILTTRVKIYKLQVHDSEKILYTKNQ